MGRIRTRMKDGSLNPIRSGFLRTVLNGLPHQIATICRYLRDDFIVSDAQHFLKRRLVGFWAIQYENFARPSDDAWKAFVCGGTRLYPRRIERLCVTGDA